MDIDRELLLHQERLQQLLDQGDSETFLDHDPHITPHSLHISLGCDATSTTLSHGKDIFYFGH